MTISISNIAWEVPQDADVAAILQRHRVGMIDIAPGKYFPDFAQADAAAMAVVRRWWQERGIAIVGMQALLFGTEGLNLFGPPAVRQRMLDHLGHVCRIGAGLGACRLVFGSPKNRDRSGLDDAQTLDLAVAFFARLAAIAAGHGVVVCLEPNPPCYGANFMTTTAETAAVVEAVNHPAIRLQFDSGALHLNNEPPAAVLAAHGSLVGHVHASEPQLLPVGTGGCNHQACAAALAQALPADTIITIEMLTRAAADPLAAIDAAVGVVVGTYGRGGER
ncbi:MAG: TIM barrel protein [Cyanobacteriota bacterium]|nr:TIM barrel protein [Cyanobacteriota bacterium]